MSKEHDAPALAKREPTISKADCEAISKAARAELRDRFAMAALTGLAVDNETYRPDPGYAAFRAYQYADAMLKARGHE
jgi:hypothetical protein